MLTVLVLGVTHLKPNRDEVLTAHHNTGNRNMLPEGR
jgi:hypothetical protein